MTAPAKGFALQRAAPYEVTWKTESVGFTKDVDPTGLKLLEREKRIDELEDVLIDIEVYGIEGGIKMALHDVGPERLRQLCPWAGATGSYSLSPPTPGYSMYGAAGSLVLHPRGVTGTASDFAFAKAFPRSVSLPKGAGGKNYSMINVEFVIFMDHTALTDTAPTAVGGYQGVSP